MAKLIASVFVSADGVAARAYRLRRHQRPGTRRSAMMKRCGATVIGCVVTILAVGCGQDDKSPTVASPSMSSATVTSTSGPASTSTAEGLTITSKDGPFGPMLWGPTNQAIYIWEREPTSTATCYDDCAKAWPPVLTTGKPIASGSVKAGLLGTTPRRDGSSQVTYNGHPLYYYANEGPGEVECHNITTHGGLWWVITPAGNRAA